MIVLGFMLGVALAAPVAFAVGFCAGIDRARHHQRADIRPALRGRWMR